MVSFRLCNNWQRISGAFGIYVYFSSHVRYEIKDIQQAQVIANDSVGPRCAIVALWYLLTARPNATLPKLVASLGIFRTFTCGGWVYVTSSDDQDWHRRLVISYIVATVLWMLGCVALSPNNAGANKYRKYLAVISYSTLVPLIYFYIQHTVYKVAGGKIYIMEFFQVRLTYFFSIYYVRLLRMGCGFV
jgi:hypothetical protein